MLFVGTSRKMATFVTDLIVMSSPLLWTQQPGSIKGIIPWPHNEFQVETCTFTLNIDISFRMWHLVGVRTRLNVTLFSVCLPESCWTQSHQDEHTVIHMFFFFFVTCVDTNISCSCLVSIRSHPGLSSTFQWSSPSHNQSGFANTCPSQIRWRNQMGVKLF